MGGSYHLLGNLLMRLVLHSCKMNTSQHPPTRILHIYIRVLMGFSHVLGPDSVYTVFLSPACILGAFLGAGKARGTYIPRTGAGGTSRCPGPAHAWTGGHIFSIPSSNNALEQGNKLQMLWDRNMLDMPHTEGSEDKRAHLVTKQGSPNDLAGLICETCEKC